MTAAFPADACEAASALVARALHLCERAGLELPAMLLSDALSCLTSDSDDAMGS